MKILNYDDFLNEKLSPINEAMNVSDELKKVKTLDEFMSIVRGKVLVITSYYDFIASLRSTPKKDKFEDITIFSDFQGNICKGISQFFTHRSGITYFVEKVGRGYIDGINPQDVNKVFEYFNFCKSKGSVIRLISMNEIQSGATEIYKKSKSIMDKIDNILSVALPIGKKVPVSAVTYLESINWSSSKTYEFDLDRATYSITLNKSGIDATIKTLSSRNLYASGYTTHAYKVSDKEKKELLSLAKEREALGNECVKWAKNFMQKYTK
jgi:hypothetical protein